MAATKFERGIIKERVDAGLAAAKAVAFSLAAINSQWPRRFPVSVFVVGQVNPAVRLAASSFSRFWASAFALAKDMKVLGIRSPLTRWKTRKISF